MPEEPRSPHVVVIGGGIAGLSAAHALLFSRPGIDVTVLEGSPQVGGKLRRDTVAGQEVDVGAESLLNRRTEATDLAAAVGLEKDLVYPVTTSAKLWSRDRLHALPTSVFGIPVASALSGRQSVLSRRGLARARLERLLPSREIRGDVAVGTLVTRRLGREVLDRLVEPMLGGVYAGRADELSLAATLPQIYRALRSGGGGLLDAAERVRAEQAPTGAQVPVFAGINGGVGRLAGAVADDVVRRGGVVRRAATVRDVRRTRFGWRVIVGPTVNPEEVVADAVVVAAPAAPAGRLLRDVSAVAAAELGSIEYASMAIVTLAFPAIETGHELPGSGFLVPPVDGRTVKAATFSSQKWDWLSRDLVLVRCSIGRRGEEHELQYADGQLVDAAVRDLRDATGLRAPVIDAAVTRWGGGLPQYAVGHLDKIARIRSALADVPGIELCGAMLNGVGVPAVIATGQQAAAGVLRHLNSRETMRA